MMNVSLIMGAILWTLACCPNLQAQDGAISLNDLDAFREPGKNWVIAGDAIADLNKQHDLRPLKGQGVAVNTGDKDNQMHLITKEEFGDLELSLDFMMARQSNAGVYLEGRYEIQLLDSWMKTDPTWSDVGAVYSRWTPEKGSFEGTAPYMNVARAPGLWQHLQIRFRAPRFDEKGAKTANATFESVYLNGVLIQQQVQTSGPTTSSIYQDEKAKGPLVIQGDHGPVAIKNISFRPLKDSASPPNYWNSVDPVTVEPGAKPSFIKTFLMHGDKKLTHVISVGNQNQVNYSYDVKEGALFQIWRGKFIDVTPAWRDRGESQLGVPMGSVISLSDAPSVAVLANEKAAWPDSVAFDTMHNKGYSLDKMRSPTFNYSIGAVNISDSITVTDNNQGINRTITAVAAPSNLYCRIVSGSAIENIAGDLYAVDGKNYYLRIDPKYKPVVRNVNGRQEMIVRYAAGSPVTYSLIW